MELCYSTISGLLQLITSMNKFPSISGSILGLLHSIFENVVDFHVLVRSGKWRQNFLTWGGHFCARFPLKEAVRKGRIETPGLRTQQCLCSVAQTVCVHQMFNLGSASLCPLRRHTQNITRGRFWEEQLKLVSRNWNRVHWKQSIRSCLFPLGNETGSSVKLSALHSVRSQARVDDWSYNSGNSETEAGGSQVVSLPGLGCRVSLRLVWAAECYLSRSSKEAKGLQ